MVKQQNQGTPFIYAKNGTYRGTLGLLACHFRLCHLSPPSPHQITHCPEFCVDHTLIFCCLCVCVCVSVYQEIVYLALPVFFLIVMPKREFFLYF